MLIWARESSGYTLEDASKRTGISIRTLRRAEKGSDYLTVNQLRKIAEYYKRPLPMFYLDKPPKDLKLPDFRSNKEIGFDKPTGNIQIKIRTIFEKKRFAEELLRRFPQKFDYEFINLFTENDDPEDCSRQVRTLLDVKAEHLSSKRDHEVLNYWIQKVENIGILVFQFQRIDPEVMRGFVFTSIPFPTIALNSGDSYYARAFTIIHELTHVILNKSGICEASYNEFPERGNIERFCNSVAGSTLVPNDFLDEQTKASDFKSRSIAQNVINLAREFKVSWSVILIRLLNSGKINRPQYSLSENELSQMKQPKKKRGSGADYYIGLNSRISKTYRDMILTGLRSTEIAFHEAMRFLDLKYNTLETFEQKIEFGELK